MEQPKAVLKRAPTSVGLPPMEQISEEAKRRDRARKRAEEKKNKEEYAKIRKRQEEIDKKRAEKEVDPMAGKKTVTREQVMAYMCGLVAMYGQNPTQAQARSYSQSNHKLIFPKNAISALGASSWEEVVAIYKAYALTDKNDWKHVKTSNSKPVEQKLEQAKQESDSKKSQDEALNSRKGKRYTKEGLLGILRELWEEMDGKVTQSKLSRRSKEKPTPSWQTLTNKLGPSSTWREQLFGSEPEVVTPEIVAPEPEAVEPEAVEPEVKILGLEAPEPNPKFSMELKITVPGMPAPVVMEFTVK